jgi:AraC family transcriptional activator of pobA
MEERAQDLDFSQVGVPSRDHCGNLGVATAAIDRGIPSFFLYGEAPHEHDERLLHVETIGSRSARLHWKIRPHLHRTLHQLLFVTRGHGVSLAEGARVEYTPPALIVVPAGTVHGFDFEPGTQGFVVSMSDDVPRDIAQREPSIRALFEHPATLEFQGDLLRATDLARSFRMLMRESARALPGRAVALEGLLTVILANVLRLEHASTDSVESGVGRHRPLVARFRELIEDAFREDWSLADYAAALNTSPSRLRNACLSVTEQSPIQLVHARVLLEAKRQLLYTSLSISEVAYALGFDDPAYFTRFFSQRVGMSPRKFRLRAAEAHRRSLADR